MKIHLQPLSLKTTLAALALGALFFFAEKLASGAVGLQSVTELYSPNHIPGLINYITYRSAVTGQAIGFLIILSTTLYQFASLTLTAINFAKKKSHRKPKCQ